MEQRINDRLQQMEERIEGIGNNLKSLEDSLAEKIMNVVNKEIESVKANLQKEIHEVRDRVTALEATDTSDTSRRSCNIVLTNVQLQNNDNDLKSQVNDIIKDGIGLNDIIVASTERKESRREGVPGVVIATLQSKEQLSSVMKNKKKLKDNENLKQVRIYPDGPWHERRNDMNFQTLMKAMADESLEWTGGRIVQKRERQNGNQPRNNGRGRGNRGFRRGGGGTGRGHGAEH